jgi:hypothetical protein
MWDLSLEKVCILGKWDVREVPTAVKISILVNQVVAPCGFQGRYKHSAEQVLEMGRYTVPELSFLNFIPALINIYTI